MKLHFTGVSSVSRAESSPPSGNITAATNVPATTPFNSLQTSRSSNFHVSSPSFILPSSSSGPTLPSENTRSSALSRSHTASGVPVVPSSLQTLALPSTNTSASDSIQISSSASVSVVSSSYVVLSLSLTPSSLGSSAVSSSVVPILPGIYVRFGINVPKNQSLSDGSFENQLREGIFSIYQNGSLDSSSRNVSIHVS